MKKTILFISLFFFNFAFSQFGIGDDILKVKKEFTNNLVNQKYKLIKVEKLYSYSYNKVTDKFDIKTDEYFYKASFKEEFEVRYNLNQYDNCNFIQINTNKKEVYLNLLKVYKSTEWDYVSSVEYENIKFYTYGKIKIKTAEKEYLSDMKYKILLYID